jgi:hypothetical protein
MSYPSTYHAACRELVAFGASVPERTTYARRIIARALWDIRRQYGRDRAVRERYHLLFIAGHFPDKVTAP